MSDKFYLDITLAAIVNLKKDKVNLYHTDVFEYISSRYTPLRIDNVSIELNVLTNNISLAISKLEDLGWISFGPKDVIIFNSIEAESIEEIDTTITNSAALNYINDLKKNDYIKLTFYKKDGNYRDISGTIHKTNQGDGYILVVDDSMPDGETGSNIRTVDLRRITSIYINNVERTITK